MSPLPKYLEISNLLIERIRSGELMPGMRIPSENEIIRAHSVSNTTARRALANIEQLGFATRVKGRGTFVRERSLVRPAARILSFSQNMRQAGRVPSTRLLEASLERRSCEAVVDGRRYTMRQPVYRIRRLRFGDNEPVLLEERFISSELCPGLLDLDLTGSLYRIYQSEYGLHLTESRQRIRSVLLDAEARAWFEVTAETPGLLIEAVTFGGKETLVEIERSIYLGDAYEFTVTATS